ncbi:MAG: sulfite exporter TauE/SafE family protein [Planctomycetota bacterium]
MSGLTGGLVDPAIAGWAALVVAAFLAGAINALAGGGTILTFPVLSAILPVDPGRMVTANATSTIGLWPASVVAAWVSRESRSGLPAWARWLVIPSFVGGAVGTLLVLCLPPALFDGLVPWLILLAAVLFAVQPQVAAWAHGDAPVSPGRIATACLLQFLVGVYGGYFGAGIGILMIAMLGLLGLGDIHRLNAVKNSLATVVNGIATAVFAGGSLVGGHDVSWPHVAVIAAAGMTGSFAASRLARKLPAATLRKLVAIIGFALAGYYFWRQWQP